MQGYNNTDRLLHALSQVIAKFNRTYVPKKDDDSHTNFYFDTVDSRLYGRWAKSEKQKYCLAIDVEVLEFQLINEERRIIFELSIHDKTISEIEKEIAEFLPEVGFKKEGFQDEMHYEIPDYDFIDTPFTLWKENEINVWKSFRSLANDACHWMKSHVMADGEIRIWPHHFDTGVYIEPNAKRGLGFGLAMKDPMVGEAYLYYSGYGLDGISIEYNDLPVLDWGRWEVSENWKGAVLPISDLQKDAEAKVQKFIKQVSGFML